MKLPLPLLLALLCATLFAALTALSAAAQSVPPLINYQGKLVNSNSIPLPTGDYELRFSIWDAATGGTQVWGPQVFNGQTGPGFGPKVPVVQGWFNVMLGPVDTNGGTIASAFTATNRFVEVQVGVNPPLSPRQQILSAPYAFRAATAAQAEVAILAHTAEHAAMAEQVIGTVVLANATNPAPSLGTIRWTGTDFEGYNGFRWISFTFGQPPAKAITNMVWIPPGSFLMGSPSDEVDRLANEGPQTQVALTWGFFMGRYQVTQWEYLSVIGNNPSSFPAYSNRPVDQVSWDNATNYCAKLTAAERVEGRLPVAWAYRLPTEAEYEYASRAGATNRFSYGDDPGYTLLGNYAWYSANSSSMTHAVGGKLPNRWGLYDIAGNLWEWCMDWYGPYAGENATDPQGSPSGQYRVLRGGVWNGGASDCRSARRNFDAPAARNYGIGFRVVLAPTL